MNRQFQSQHLESVIHTFIHQSTQNGQESITESGQQATIMSQASKNRHLLYFNSQLRLRSAPKQLKRCDLKLRVKNYKKR